MKLDHLPEYITIVVTVILGLLLSIYMGMSAGSGSKTPYIIVGAVLAATVALVMREKVWLLIPLAWPLTGRFVGLPGAFPARDIVIIYVFIIFIALKALKVVRNTPRYRWLDYLLFINLVYLISVYLRNPVGTQAMGFEKVGGRTYFEAIFAVMGFWVISHMTISPKLAWVFPLITVAGEFFQSIVCFITFHFPFTAPIIGRFYSGIDVSTYNALDVSKGMDEVEREGYLGSFGRSILLTLYSWVSPLSTMNPLYILRFIGAAIGLIAILKSGFRTSFITVAVYWVLAEYFRHGISRVIQVIFVILPLISLLLLAQGTVFELPATMQRTLSFLPAQWDQAVVANANDSTEWRLDLWSNVWNSGNKYIDNWWFGDGFGMTQAQLSELSNPISDIKENLTIAGDYHSLPLSAIHTVGYVGFAIFLVLFFGMSYESIKVIQLCYKTPYFPIALFVGMPLIYTPLPSLILTGFFKFEIVQSIISVAMLGLIRRSLENYLTQENDTPSTPEFQKNYFGSALDFRSGPAQIPNYPTISRGEPR